MVTSMITFIMVILLVMSLVIWVQHLRLNNLQDDLKSIRKYVTDTSTVQHSLNSDVTKIIGDVVLHVKEIERGE